MNQTQESDEALNRAREREAPVQAFSRSWVSKPAADRSDAQEIHITGIKIPFWSLVFFMVKAAIASIPALVVLSVLYGLLAVLLRAALSIRF